MATIHILIGTMLGTAEYVAEHLQSLLEQDGYSTRLHADPDWQILADSTDEIWLVVTSTHGAGELPDNLQPLANSLAQSRPDLSTLRYAVIALGSSAYDTFCHGGMLIDQLLAGLGARSLLPRLEIDVLEHDLPEDPAEAWLPKLSAVIEQVIHK